jgi:hypothetical protein
MVGPYCTGALTPSGNAARLWAPQRAQTQSWARCSVTTSGRGAGRSNTWRAPWPLLIAGVTAAPQAVQEEGKWSTMLSGTATCSRVQPWWPFCPPDPRPDPSRRLRVRCCRGGFWSPSLDGGLPLLVLLRARRRSSSANRAFNAAISAACRAISAACAATSAISSSRDSAACDSRFGFIESLNRKSVKKSYPPTWAARLSMNLGSYKKRC